MSFEIRSGRDENRSVVLKYGLGLAPMAGVTDRAFREVCRTFGAEYTVSEMVSAKALCIERKSKNYGQRCVSGSIACTLGEDLPMAVQLFGHEPAVMAEAAAMLESADYGGGPGAIAPSVIDINCGCPVRKIVSNGEGSALLLHPERIGEIVRAVCDAVTLPVTVKIRIGWDETLINAPTVARICEQAGAAALCVHARTREEGYTPGIHLDVLKQAVEAVGIPVFGNGDLYTVDDVIRMKRETGCRGVMLGRGVMGNPWLFAELTARERGETFCAPDESRRLAVALGQVARMIELKGERVGVAEGKKQLAWYCRGMAGAAAVRNRVMQAQSFEEMKRAVLSDSGEN